MDVTADQARTLVAACRAVVDGAARRLAGASAAGGRIDVGLLDREQALAYDLATVAGQVSAAEEMLAYADHGAFEAALTVGFAGDVAAGLAARLAGREAAWGVDADSPWHEQATRDALAAARAPALTDHIAERVLSSSELPRHLDEERQMVRETFRDYAEAKVAPVAERIHRDDEDIPDEIITDLAEMGAFGLSIPERYGGFAQGGSEDDVMAMVLVTEELSRGSLGVAGSLITRPEILSKALISGGTDEQRDRWLPGIASGELMCAVAVTEPDHGSDVAGLTVSAVRDGDAYVLNGTKTWCTFGGRADLLMVLARTGSPEDGHRGLSLFVIEKRRYPGHAFRHEGAHGGVMDARAIGTIGYRGMHSFEISFEDYRVPAANLVGGEDGRGRGFYLQMGAFANGRLQTAARALGLMQAAFDAAVAYTTARHVFGVPLADYPLTRAKLAMMAWRIAACRRFAYRSATLLGRGGPGSDAPSDGQLEASMVKSLACLSAEWLTREAQQLHGGMGYAEEYPVSRYFVDARVLSIFEGADEVLALRVIARSLLAEALTG
ncbi:MAG: acyl-CoA dehydrogenase family protein [Egibacteraceae bacterium]